MAFREGVDVNERIFKENYYREAYENVPFKARYDLTYLTPTRRQLRCKVGMESEKSWEFHFYFLRSLVVKHALYFCSQFDIHSV